MAIRDEITVDYVLTKFKEILDSEAEWNVKVRALELLGKFLNMFVDQKKVNIDVRQLIAGASLDDLRALAGEYREKTDRLDKDVAPVPRERYLGMHRADGDRSELESGD